MRAMQRTGALVLMVLAGAAISPGQTPVQGRIEDLVKVVRDSMPGEGSRRFVVPLAGEQDTWGQIFAAMDTGQFWSLPEIVNGFNYELLQFSDTTAHDTLMVLMERIPVLRGWGMYVLDPDGDSSLAIEIPHPRADTNTCVFGIRSARLLRARWFLMAGTHRYANGDTSSDMAHTVQSVFHTAHRTLGVPSAIQLHGFDRTNPIYNGYPEIVISNGTLSPPSRLYQLQAAYQIRGLTAGVFSSGTYGQLWRLGATQNRQGQWSNNNARAFVHLEHELPIRLDSVRMECALAAMREVFRTSTSAELVSILPAEPDLIRNYPNPFNNSTMFEVVVPRTGPVDLTVFDLMGRRVAHVVRGEMFVGIHRIPFDARGLSRGVYFYRLMTNSIRLTRKMVIQ